MAASNFITVHFELQLLVWTCFLCIAVLAVMWGAFSKCRLCFEDLKAMYV